MTLRWMYDASEPPPQPPHWHAAAGYIGGDTPHVWTLAEWKAQPAPLLLPIFTASNRLDNACAAGEDAWEILNELAGLGVPRGCTVVVDTETTLYTAYLRALDRFVHDGGYPLMNYGSLSFVIRNPLTSGGRWAADWTGLVQTGLVLDGVDGIRAIQIASSAMTGHPWDWSLIEDSIPLWQRP